MSFSPPSSIPSQCDAIVIGAGPAGLMAAEAIAQAGITVHIFDAMPSVGRKLLLAGKGGLNLTHSEPTPKLIERYGAPAQWLAPMIERFGGPELRQWAADLGVETFVGTSGRVFPHDMKAAPLLRAWLHRLRGMGVQLHMRHRWLGWGDDGSVRFATEQGEIQVRARTAVLALGGASWARLGSDGAWVPLLQQRGIPITPLEPANCGFDVQRSAHRKADAAAAAEDAAGWTPYFATRFAGQPLKSVTLNFTDAQGHTFVRKGEFVATATGVEGSLIYAASSLLRQAINTQGHATFTLDLLPDFTAQRVLDQVSHPRGSRTLSSHLKSRLGLDGIKAGLLHEQLDAATIANPQALAAAIKAIPVTVVAARPINEAISTAGGISAQALDDQLMLRGMPGVFCAGEMLDWEAPTGGYLLTACWATGLQAGKGVCSYLQQNT